MERQRCIEIYSEPYIYRERHRVGYAQTDRQRYSERHIDTYTHIYTERETYRDTYRYT